MSLGLTYLADLSRMRHILQNAIPKTNHRVDALRFPQSAIFLKSLGAYAPVRSALRSDANAMLITRAVELPEGAGGANRDRTDDLLLAKQALSQLSYGPNKDGGSGKSRTSDLTLIRGAL